MARKAKAPDKVRGYLVKWAAGTVAEIAAEVRLSGAAVSGGLRKLKQDGVVRRDTGGVYVLTPEGGGFCSHALLSDAECDARARCPRCGRRPRGWTDRGWAS